MKKLNIFLHLLVILYGHLYIPCEAITGRNVRLANGNEFKFVVSVSVKNHVSVDKEDHVCGGALITRKHVLTSAHCKEYVGDVKDVVVKVGSNDLNYAKKFDVKSWTTYDEWAWQNNMVVELFDHDISIVKLSQRVSSKIKPAKITKDSYLDFYGKQAVTAAWGPANNDATPRFLKVATLKVISYTECMQNLKDEDPSKRGFSMDITYLCTNAQPYDVLDCGDAGSPLLINGNEIIGINDPTCSLRKRVHFSHKQNLHIAVDYYRSFIDSVTKEERSKWWRKN